MADTKTTTKKPKTAKPKAAAKTAKPKAAAKTAKPRPTQDEAGRPSPPDRDGNGTPGGSLPGNQTVEGAKGTDEAVLARREIAEDGTATIILKGVNIGRKTHHPVGVNGRIRNLKVGVQVQVNAAELEALVASHVEFETVSDDTGAAAVEGSSAAAETPAEAPTDPVVDTQGEGSGEGDGNPNPEGTEPATGEVTDGEATPAQEGTEGDTGNGETGGAQA